jgi:hypothetical protein
VPLTSELKAELLNYAHKSVFIFGQGTNGKSPRQEAISVAFGGLMRDIGLEGVTHHVLRHTGASAIVAAGISLRVVQDIGGWSTLRMLERYAHPSGAEMSRAVRVLSAYTTGTRTSTATKNTKRDQNKSGAASGVKSEVSEWRPQGERILRGTSRSLGKRSASQCCEMCSFIPIGATIGTTICVCHVRAERREPKRRFGRAACHASSASRPTPRHRAGASPRQ